jgi:DNA helicase-2/ATP-dependent DNA helicase PcrA
VELNDAQKMAVSHFEGPMMVLAGPGSGKTRVITHRVRFLIEEKKINPENILVITFTKAAAVEMRRRYQQMAPAHSAPVQFSTFHAIFFTILKHAYHYNAGNIIRDEVRHQILKEITDSLDLEIADENEFISDLGSQISRVKGSQIRLEHYHSPTCPEDVFRKSYETYQRELERRRLIDFDDMLVYCYELLEQRPDIRQMWHRQYPFILIDEFQDINQVQYDVVKLLAMPQNNLFVVGDDDQSIYGFRGARPDIMQSFVKEFSPERCTLNVNYRSSHDIIEVAGKVIDHNKNRLSKAIVAAGQNDDASGQGAKKWQGRPAEGMRMGDALRLQEFPRMTEQNEKIRDEILAYRNQGIPYKEMAVLFRTNTQARAITAKLKSFNIPFVMREMVPNLYDHWIVRDILTYIRVAQGSRERGNVMRIINRPKRYVHRNAMTEPFVDLEELKLFYEDKEWMVDRLDEFEEDLKMIAGMRPYAAVNYIRRGVGYDEYIREYGEYRGIRCDDMYEILDELQEESKGYKTFQDWFAYIEEYGEELKKQTEKSRSVRAGQEQKEDAVMIMTMHGAKGLEFECVFIPDANEGVTPHNKAVLTQDMEEERRLFYVAMTRAKKHLHIYYLKERFNKEVSVSRFVEEILAGTETGDAAVAAKKAGAV